MGVERVISIIGVFCTLILAGVGVYGICVALLTVRTIQRQSVIMMRQARIMQRQSRTLEQQTAATEKAAEAARDNIQLLINKERAQIRVQPERVEIPKLGVGVFSRINDSSKSPIIYYKILCYGVTKADIVDSCSHVEITASSEPPAIRNYTVSIPELPPVMLTNAEGLQRVNFAFDRPKVSLDRIAEAISKGEMFLHFWGFISYRILFDNEVHWARFRYIYGVQEPFLIGLGLGLEPSWWKAGPEEDNQET